MTALVELPNLDLDLKISRTNAAVDRTAVRPSDWNETIAQQYEVGKSIDTTGWTYWNNFRHLNMYQGWTQVCQCCDNPIRQCSNNETLHFKATQWQEYLKNMSNATIERNEESTEVIERTPTGRRAKGSFAKVVASDIADTITNQYNNGSTIATLANEHMIAPTAIRSFLSDAGILRGRGQSVNRTSVRTRKTSQVTPEIIAQAMTMLPDMGVVKAAKELNVNTVELSTALKAAGASISRGARKKNKA